MPTKICKIAVDPQPTLPKYLVHYYTTPNSQPNLAALQKLVQNATRLMQNTMITRKYTEVREEFESNLVYLYQNIQSAIENNLRQMGCFSETYSICLKNINLCKNEIIMFVHNNNEERISKCLSRNRTGVENQGKYFLKLK
jgi:hypothetical protein